MGGSCMPVYVVDLTANGRATATHSPNTAGGFDSPLIRLDRSVSPHLQLRGMAQPYWQLSR